ncbi:hypothetical protein VTO73DRAFT_13942 [Trametes versicolor]
MGLTEHKVKYNQLMAEVLAKHEDMKNKYAGHWPIRAMLQQFLLNSKSRKKHMEAASDSEPEDSDIPAKGPEIRAPPCALTIKIRAGASSHNQRNKTAQQQSGGAAPRTPEPEEQADEPRRAAEPADWPSPRRCDELAADQRALRRYAAPPEAADFDTGDFMQQMGDDLFDFTKADDPYTTVCPNIECTDKIPSSPSPMLRRMLDKRRTTLLKGKQRNQSGSMVTMNTSICHEIAYELELLPEAHERGWPIAIDCNVLAVRVRLMMQDLTANVLARPQDTFMWSLLDEDQEGAKIREIASQFKRNPIAESLKVTFERTRVGYYGEEGEVVISGTLDVLFPTWQVDAAQCAPFSVEGFKRFILVPECALRLITEDSLSPYAYQRCNTLSAAYDIMNWSSEYGYHRFRLDGSSSRSAQNIQKENLKLLGELRKLAFPEVDPTNDEMPAHASPKRPVPRPRRRRPQSSRLTLDDFPKLFMRIYAPHQVELLGVEDQLSWHYRRGVSSCQTYQDWAMGWSVFHAQMRQNARSGMRQRPAAAPLGVNVLRDVPRCHLPLVGLYELAVGRGARAILATRKARWVHDSAIAHAQGGRGWKWTARWATGRTQTRMAVMSRLEAGGGLELMASRGGARRWSTEGECPVNLPPTPARRPSRSGSAHARGGHAAARADGRQRARPLAVCISLVWIWERVAADVVRKLAVCAVVIPAIDVSAKPCTERGEERRGGAHIHEGQSSIPAPATAPTVLCRPLPAPALVAPAPPPALMAPPPALALMAPARRLPPLVLLT